MPRQLEFQTIGILRQVARNGKVRTMALGEYCWSNA